MPNWCSTRVEIECVNDETAKALFDRIAEWTSSNKAENGFGHNWLGNVVLGSKIGTVDTCPETDVHCRGEIADKDLYKNTVVLYTETAWAPLLHMWQLVADKYAPGADICYTAEEPGCALFATNDPDLEGKYYLDFWDSGYTIYDATPESAAQYLQERLESDETDLDTLIEMLLDAEIGDVHRWQGCPIEEWD